ncbi:hypothetical protein OSSY52_17790 [Tepiditoga spiralis]|uniref:Uncharacterized protein n=1 Tax=Tepiditoga spiralis TaxID=2108365 RepID=A0A7G1G507_9BACT|nr:hypothetical protein [Tepiditoga spiralis]BBE31638.1 hypothetical protein OSSY52_17790 [Tepiditoga spiralis]
MKKTIILTTIILISFLLFLDFYTKLIEQKYESKEIALQMSKDYLENNINSLITKLELYKFYKNKDANKVAIMNGINKKNIKYTIIFKVNLFDKNDKTEKIYIFLDKYYNLLKIKY